MEAQRLRAMIASAQAGKAQGYEALLEAYGPRLYGYFFRATGSHHDAEDLLSDLTLRLVRMLKHYDDRGRFEPWLFRVAANIVRDRIRRSKANPTPASLSLEDESGQPLVDRLGDAKTETVAEGLLAAEMSERLDQAMERLDATAREMILLRYFGQMSFKEIAEIFQCPPGTVLAKVHRGLGRLRKLMEGKYGPQ